MNFIQHSLGSVFRLCQLKALPFEGDAILIVFKPITVPLFSLLLIGGDTERLQKEQGFNLNFMFNCRQRWQENLLFRSEGREPLSIERIGTERHTEGIVTTSASRTPIYILLTDASKDGGGGERQKAHQQPSWRIMFAKAKCRHDETGENQKGACSITKQTDG